MQIVWKTHDGWGLTDEFPLLTWFSLSACIWPAAKWRKSSFSKKKRKEFIICVCACLKPWGLDPRPNHENYCSTTSSAANLSVSIQLTCGLQSAQELLALACPLLLLDHWSNHFIQAWDFCSNRNIDMMCDKNTDDFVLKTCWISCQNLSWQAGSVMRTILLFCTLHRNASSDERRSWQDLGSFSKHSWEPLVLFPFSLVQLSTIKHLFDGAFCVTFVLNITLLK